MRAHLPNRRSTLGFEVHHDSCGYHVGVGLYQDGAIGEVFITPMGKAGKGSAIEALARDAAIMISLGVQFGVPIETMRGAVTRNENGRPATLVGAVLDGVKDWKRGGA